MDGPPQSDRVCIKRIINTLTSFFFSFIVIYLSLLRMESIWKQRPFDSHDTFSDRKHNFKGLHWDVLYRFERVDCVPKWYAGFQRAEYRDQLAELRYQFAILGKDNEVLSASTSK